AHMSARTCPLDHNFLAPPLQKCPATAGRTVRLLRPLVASPARAAFAIGGPIMPRSLPLLLLLAATAASCDGGGDRGVTLRFDPRFGDQPFACGREFAGIGTSGAAVTPLDFRLYLHDIALVRASGERVPLLITDDGTWQHDGMVLLDFEDGSGACAT